MVRDAVAASVTYPAPSRPQQPGVGGGDRAVCGQVLPQPGHLRRGEVRVERQAGDRGQFGRAVREPRADAPRPAVLPDDRGGQRLAGAPVPGQHGLALVGQRDRVRRRARRGQRLAARREDRIEQLLRVGLHPVRAHAAGADGDLAAAEHLGARPDEERLGRRRALVDGQDVHPSNRAPGPVPSASPPARSPAAPRRTPAPGRGRRARSTARRGTRPA